MHILLSFPLNLKKLR